MGRLVPKIVPGDWNGTAHAIAKLDHALNTGSEPTFAGLTLADLTASRLVATDGAKAIASVADLTSWIAGTTDHISVANDGDGTVTVDLDTNTQILLGSFNGMFLEKINFTISEAGGTVTGSLEQNGGGDLTQKFSDGYTTLDCTPALTINLTAYVGTNAVPKEVFVYILQSAKTVIAASNSDWPATEHIKIARLILKSAAATGTDGGALGNQNWNDYAFDATGEGHILHVEHRLRQEPAQYTSGIALTLKNSAGAALTTGNSSTAVEIVTTEGKVFQLHKHTYPAFDMYTTATDLADIVNQPTDEGGAYETTANLVTDITHYVDGTAAGVAIGANKYFNLVVWGVQNREGEVSQLMINLPTGQYATESAATADIDGTSTFDIPLAFKGTGFLIARLTFRLIAGAQWTYIAQEDLRGQFPGLSAGVGVTTTDHALLANLTFAAAGHTGFQAQGDVLDDLNTLGAVASDGQFIVGTGAGAFAYETPAQALATLSGAATAAFAWNSQNLTGVGTLGCGVITQSGTTLANTYQPLDAELTSLAALSYVSASFVKMTGANTFALRTIGETADDLEGTIVHDNLASVHQDVTTTGTPQFATLGIGRAAGAANKVMLYVDTPTLNTSFTFYGLRINAIKTAGATNTSDQLFGIESLMEINDTDASHGNIRGLRGQTFLTAGTVGADGTVRHLYGGQFVTYQGAGICWGDMYGLHNTVSQAGGTLDRDMYASYNAISVAGTVNGTSYGVYLVETGSIDYGFYQYGTAANVFGGTIASGKHTITDDSTDWSLLVCNDTGDTNLPVIAIHRQTTGLTGFTAIRQANAATQIHISEANFKLWFGLYAELSVGNYANAVEKWSCTSSGDVTMAGALTGVTNVTMAGALTGSTAISVASNLFHTGNTDTYLGFSTDVIDLYVGGNSLFQVNTTNIKIGDHASANNVAIAAATGNMTFVGDAGFYPRFLTQASEPAAGTGATQLDTSEMCIWKDLDDNKIYFCFNDSGTIKTTEAV